MHISSRQLRGGVMAKGAELSFLGWPILDGDTIAFIPVPMKDLVGARNIIRRIASLPAINRLRDIFFSITSNWALTAPASPNAREAVAISLEIRGDPAAIDSLASAQKLSTDPASVPGWLPGASMPW